MIPAGVDSDRAIAEVEDKARAASLAARALATSGSAVRDAALVAMADALGDARPTLLDANARDLSLARDKGVAPHMVDRLALNDQRIAGMQEGLRQIAGLPDPIGVVVGGWRRPNGLQITQVRVPLGVVGIIYESRPNVTVDAAALCLKSGNATVLRGGSEAIHSNTALTAVLRDALASVALPADAVNLIETTDRAAARHLMTLNRYLDCLIPRGGASLIQTVVQNATVPVIETGTGNCHVYVHADADPEMATEIVLNAKCQRPSTCNAAETLLLHVDLPQATIVGLLRTLHDAGVQIRGCERTPLIGKADRTATEEDYFAEFNDLILAVKIVDSLDDAIAHINHYGTRHSEAILTRDYASAQKFCDQVDAAAVYVNASTRFTDGYEFGFGAEIGISNQKLHARGPMGLEALTTTKYVVRGNGQVR
jgi:glutamate-5-semialdehyde dehydrogenase